MVHDYLEGNIVRDISNGQEMKITTVRKGLFNDEPSGYVVCEWEEDGVAQKREFHVDDIEFMSEGDAKPYDIDKQGDYNPISRKGLFVRVNVAPDDIPEVLEPIASFNQSSVVGS